MSFFDAPQAAAILKHGLLRRYLPVFATKTGSVAGEVVYLDGYAGPGLYSDGSDGSPALALATAEAIAGSKGNASLHGHLVEQSADAVASLRSLLASHGANWEVHHGRAEDHVPGILTGLGSTVPLFAFIDPFGLPIPFTVVVDIMKRGGTLTGFGRVGGAATELLMNFSNSGINRVGGQLTATGTDPTWLKARGTMVAKMDDVLGGDWWQEIWRSGDSARVDQIRAAYVTRLRNAAGGGWATFDIGVSDRWQGPTAYHLLLFTQHPDGVWTFHENLSLANEEYRAYCHSTQGLLDLEPLQQREVQWIQHLEANVERVLDSGKAFQPVRRMVDVFGDAFGEARETHLRKALKNLEKRGKTSTEVKGKLARIWVKP